MDVAFRAVDNEQAGPGRWLNPTAEADPLPNAGFLLPVKASTCKPFLTNNVSPPKQSDAARRVP